MTHEEPVREADRAPDKDRDSACDGGGDESDGAPSGTLTVGREGDA